MLKISSPLHIVFVSFSVHLLLGAVDSYQDFQIPNKILLLFQKLPWKILNLSSNIQHSLNTSRWIPIRHCLLLNLKIKNFLYWSSFFYSLPHFIGTPIVMPSELVDFIFLRFQNKSNTTLFRHPNFPLYQLDSNTFDRITTFLA